MALALSLSLFLILAIQSNGTLWGGPVENGFYAIFPHNLMVSMFAPIFLWSVLALALGVTKFWREVTPSTSGAPLSSPAAAEAAHDALRLKYLGGGHGDGCNNEDDAFTLARKRMHHLTFYGFMLCFAATSVATVYHYAFDWPAPYDFFSLPKILGTVGGIALTVGTLGLWRLNLARDPQHGDAQQRPMDRGFIALLFFISVTGLALMLSKNTAAMPVLLAVHLGMVMALFLTLPYGKFAHGIFRTAALLRFAVEKRQPSKLTLGSD
jgi:citrate/tricarballylate utilization protein